MTPLALQNRSSMNCQRVPKLRPRRCRSELPELRPGRKRSPRGSRLRGASSHESVRLAGGVMERTILGNLGSFGWPGGTPNDTMIRSRIIVSLGCGCGCDFASGRAIRLPFHASHPGTPRYTQGPPWRHHQQTQRPPSKYPRDLRMKILYVSSCGIPFFKNPLV